jgi:hypothetical protein
MEGNVLLKRKRELASSLYRRLRINPLHYAEARREIVTPECYCGRGDDGM